MRINKIPSYNTNFTSRVAVAIHDGFLGLGNDNIIKTEDYIFKREFEKLENNGNDDDVIFEFQDYNNYKMTVTENSENGRRVYDQTISYAGQISRKYEEAKTALSNGRGYEYPLSGPIAKYVNRVPDNNDGSNICIISGYCDKNKLSQLVKSKNFQEEIKKLEHRDEKDTVVFFPDLSLDMTISRRDSTDSHRIRFIKSVAIPRSLVSQKYAEAKELLDCDKETIDSSLVEYMI